MFLRLWFYLSRPRQEAPEAQWLLLFISQSNNNEGTTKPIVIHRRVEIWLLPQKKTVKSFLKSFLSECWLRQK